MYTVIIWIRIVLKDGEGLQCMNKKKLTMFKLNLLPSDLFISDAQMFHAQFVCKNYDKFLTSFNKR